jgi:cell division FtsZ-interacting protein ZapD
MLTLRDINELTNSHDGDIYSDLYKDVYGSRPRYAQFESLEDFDADFKRLVERLNEQQDEEAKQQLINRERFEQRVKETMELVLGTDRARAIEIIADADGELEDMKFYGYERLEWCYDLGFGYIKGTM